MGEKELLEGSGEWDSPYWGRESRRGAHLPFQEGPAILAAKSQDSVTLKN